jgi:predicted DCC family thiol-disulfide oxidoreductase YuxK
MSTFVELAANYPLSLYFDGACPLCRLEIDNLQARDAQQLLRFVDIAGAGFDPAPLGVSLSALNGLIHATRPDGSLLVGVEVFRLAYAAVGLGRWTAPTGWPGLKPVVDAAYRLFARNRQTISRVFFKSAAPCNRTVCKPVASSISSSRSTS